MRRAVIGERRLNSLREAAERWHRRAAAVAALRDEHQRDQPGWPALCPDWSNADGGHALVPLVTAEQPVAEGNALNHCVGGYYETCRAGNTQILSLQHDGQRLATVEIRLGPDLRHPTLTVGQFEGDWRARPDADRHVVLRQFLRDLRTGQHPLHLGALERYRRRRATEWPRYASTALPLSHARGSYPLHRALLPRTAPDSFDAWPTESGLLAGMDTVLELLAPVPQRELPLVA